MPRFKDISDTNSVSKVRGMSVHGSQLTDPEYATLALLSEAQKAREDLSKFYELVMKHELTKEPLIPAPHQQLMFDFATFHDKAVLRLPVGTGKCVTGDTLIVNPADGIPKKISDIINDENVSSVMSWNEKSGVVWKKVSGKYRTGKKKCIKIITRTGRNITTTPEHPYMTPYGWRQARSLSAGNSIGVPSRIPRPIQTKKIKDSHLFLLALLFSEGCTTVSCGFSTGDKTIVRMAQKASDDLGCDVKYREKYDYGIVRRIGHEKENPAIRLTKEHGLYGCKAIEKRIPPFIFSCSAEQISKFLAIVWMCDGSIDTSNASICLGSEKGISDIQHLLLRLGIQSVKKYKKTYLKGKRFHSWRLTVRSDSLTNFKTIAEHMWGSKLERFRRLLNKKRNPNYGNAVVDRTFQNEFLNELKIKNIKASDIKRIIGWSNHATISEACFTSTESENGSRGIGIGFGFAAKLAGLKKYDFITNGNIYWDQVESIKEVGKKEVYDLTVPGTDCFVGNDIIAHNTYGMGAMTLWLVGADNTQRGAIISKTRTQAQKVLSMVKDYIEEPSLNPPLILVYPGLKRSTRQQDPWTQSAIAIERPPGIRDPSLVAAGLGFSISGARLSWLLTDDVIDDENTANSQLREDVQSKFDGRLISRMDPTNSRVIVCNTPWHREDLTYHLEQRGGWPTLVMDIYGYIRFSNVSAAWANHALNVYLRPSTTRVDDEFNWYRLKAFDPDPDETTPLWKERYSAERIREIRYGKEGKGGMLPHEFARLFLCQPLSDDAARCQRDWIEKCKKRGMGLTLLASYEGDNFTYTGIDVGIGVGKRHDLTVFHTVELLPDNSRRLIDMESGRFSGPVIVEKLIQKSNRYKSALWVEGNAAQKYLVQFAQDKDKSLRVQAHTTTKANKQNVDFGVESIFTELKNEAWIIPCDMQGRCDHEVQEWINEMLYYQPPPAHTGDRLMASWICREAIRKAKRTRLPPKIGRKRELVSSGQF